MGSRDHDWGGERACVAFVAFAVYGARRRLDCFSLRFFRNAQGDWAATRTCQSPVSHSLNKWCVKVAVGDILKAVGEEDRRDLPYRHLAFAIRTDFHSGHYGTCRLGAHDVSFRPTTCRGERKGSPWIGCPSVWKARVGNWPGRYATAALSRTLCALLSARVEEKWVPPFAVLISSAITRPPIATTAFWAACPGASPGRELSQIHPRHPSKEWT